MLDGFAIDAQVKIRLRAPVQGQDCCDDPSEHGTDDNRPGRQRPRRAGGINEPRCRMPLCYAAGSPRSQELEIAKALLANFGARLAW